MSSTSVKVAPPASVIATPTPSRKEHLNAGRRRLAEFRERKKAESSKKASLVKSATETDGKVSAQDGPSAVPAGGSHSSMGAVAGPPFAADGPATGADQTETRDSAAGAAGINGEVEYKFAHTETNVLQSNDPTTVVFSLTPLDYSLSDGGQRLSPRSTATDQFADAAVGARPKREAVLGSEEFIAPGSVARPDFALSAVDQEEWPRRIASYQSVGNGHGTAGGLSAYSAYTPEQPSTGMDEFSAVDHHTGNLTWEKYSSQRGIAPHSGAADQRRKEQLPVLENINQQDQVVNQDREDLAQSEAEPKDSERSRQASVINSSGNDDGKTPAEQGSGTGFLRGVGNPPFATLWSLEDGKLGARDGFSAGAATMNGVGADVFARSPSRKVDKHWQPLAGVDDFSALEQHIEDLTQEKYSLQRGLASANEVANQLAKEHSSLTENYNQQGKVVNQLREELARHQAEIKAQTLVISSMRTEREKAQHESAVAVEQSKTLAAEVVALEERLLQVKSQSLKLERSMESLTTENEQQKKKVMVLEKDRANLKSMFDAVQEEKKMLATRLHEASKSQQAPASHSTPVVKVDACTYTEDILLTDTRVTNSVSQHVTQDSGARGLSTALEHLQSEDSGASLPASHPSSSQAGGSSVLGTSAAGASEVASVRVLNTSIHSLQLPPLASTIPDSHLERIKNIDGLIKDLADDKVALMRALNAESAAAAELRSENMELLQKLEAQTQRLELVIAQGMAAQYGTASRAEAPSPGEGEGVLGWIKWLIPSRSSPASRRRYKRL